MKRPFTLSRLSAAIISAAYFFTGCATVNATTPGSPAGFIKRSGLASDVKNLWLTANIVDPKTSFSPEDPHVTWWAEFTELAFLTKQKFIAKWYSPDGELFMENSGSTFKTNFKYATAVLPLKNTAAAQKIGNWRVEIYRKDVQIDEQSFLVGSPQEVYSLAQSAGTPPEKSFNKTEIATEKKNLADAGLAVEARDNPLESPKPILTLPGEAFRSTDTKIAWWGVIPLWSFANWDSTATVRWYDPKDVLVMETPVSTRVGETLKFGSASLPMHGQPWSNQSGRWRVEVIRRGEIIDSRFFNLAAEPETTPMQYPAMPDQVAFEAPSDENPEPAGTLTIPIKRVAILVFPASSGSFNIRDDTDISQENLLEEPVPMYLEFPDNRLSVPERYGYSLIYNTLTGKYQPSFSWEKERRFDLFTPSLDQQDWASWHQRFPSDISEQLSLGFTEVLRNHGFHVADLTPYRHQLEGCTGNELIEQYAQHYGADALLLIGYVANSASYSSTVTYPYKNIRWKVGLDLTYQAALYEVNHRRSLFHFTEQVSPFPEGAVLGMDRVTYLNKNGFPIAQNNVSASDKKIPPPAVLEDQWVIERVVARIQGKEYGETEKVWIGGDFAAALPYAE